VKLAAIIAVAKYDGTELCELPGCAQDASLIHTVLSAQEDYTEILSITKDTNSAEVKQHLIEFVNKVLIPKSW
jgi:hypothetical protein